MVVVGVRGVVDECTVGGVEPLLRIYTSSHDDQDDIADGGAERHWRVTRVSGTGCDRGVTAARRLEARARPGSAAVTVGTFAAPRRSQTHGPGATARCQPTLQQSYAPPCTACRAIQTCDPRANLSTFHKYARRHR